jgi:hypothetical protein
VADSERELRLRHTSEGAEKVEKDLRDIGEQEKRVAGETENLGKSTEDLNLKKENFVNILNQIHPALGGLFDSMANATEAAGALGSANLDLTKILGGVRDAVAKNLDAFKLLGAGGAAVAAVLFLIKTVQSLKREMEEVLELQEKFNEQNRQLIDKGREFEELVANAVESGQIAPLVGEEFEIARRRFDQARREGRGATAFEEAVGLRPPPTAEQREAVRRVRGDEVVLARIREELIKGKTLGTREREFIEGAGFTQEDIDRLRRVIQTGSPEERGAFIQPSAVTPEEFIELDTGRLQELAQRLGLLQLTLDRLEQQPSGFNLETGYGRFLKDFVLLLVSKELDAREIRRSGEQVIRYEGDAALSRSAGELEDAARELKEGAQENRSASERSAQHRHGHGTTSRRVAETASEG